VPLLTIFFACCLTYFFSASVVLLSLIKSSFLCCSLLVSSPGWKSLTFNFSISCCFFISSFSVLIFSCFAFSLRIKSSALSAVSPVSPADEE